jgi:hypothetical protein
MVRGSSYCFECREARVIVNLCNECGDRPKRPGRGVSLCEVCFANRLPKPCWICGERKPKSRSGQRYCNDCQDIAAEIRQAKSRARTVKARNACDDCGKRRGQYRRKYCDACAKRHLEERRPQLCRACMERPRRGYRLKYCVECNNYVKDLKRRRRRKQTSKRRQRTPAERRSDQENGRIRARLKAERDGRDFRDDISLGRTRGYNPGKMIRLPAAPLAQLFNEKFPQTGSNVERREWRGHNLMSFCESIGVPDKNVRDWITGARETALFDVVERVLIGFDLLWFDVYDHDRWPDLYPPERWAEVEAMARRAFEGEDLMSAA